MTCVEAVLLVWLSLPAWFQDAKLTRTERTELYRPSAEAVCSVTEDDRLRAVLMAIASDETHLARYVLEDRCKDGPPGMRCDDGQAIGAWQVRQYCTDAWDRTRTRRERDEAAIRCSLKAYWAAQARCSTREGPFMGHRAAGGCSAPWARARLRLSVWIEGRLRQRLRGK